MNFSKTHLSNRAIAKSERIWPLDLGIGILACVVLYISIDRLSFSDTRWLYNAWTYLISVPLSACVMAFVSHSLISKHAQKSIQIGLLFSLLLHFLLLAVAINVVIFNQYFPADDIPIRGSTYSNQKFISDTLSNGEKTKTDWSQAVETSIVSKPMTQLKNSEDYREASKIAFAKTNNPRIKSKPPLPTSISLDLPGDSQPRIADRQRALAFQNSDISNALSDPSEPVAPQVATGSESVLGSSERSLSTLVQRIAPISSPIPSPSTVTPEVRVTADRPKIATKTNDQSKPSIADLKESRMEIEPSASPSGLSASVTLPIQIDDTAIETLAPFESRDTGSKVTRPKSNSTNGITLSEFPSLNSESRLATNQTNGGAGIGILKDKKIRKESEIGSIARSMREKISSNGSSPTNRLTVPKGTYTEEADIGFNRSTDLSVLISPPRISTVRREPSLRGSAEIMDLADPKGNTFSSNIRKPTTAKIADLTLTPTTDLNSRNPTVPNIGGKTEPRSAIKITQPKSSPPWIAPKITPAPSFTQRVLRTAEVPSPMENGTPPPTQDTEDAIELGLQYLASVQNIDGSWSLQGHGVDVILRSDTAATGLALLAFQGAGYTHQKNTHAAKVRGGLQFLLRHQSDDGNLYRQENAISNQNVAFYSHGIAALALCEAYGMTGDPSLQTAAQRALDFISDTQHRQRGGWRYSAQVSSDTSVTGWMMMALKSGQLAGLETKAETYQGIAFWLSLAQSDESADRYRYNPFAPDTPTQRHGRIATPTMTAVAALMRMYSGWTRENRELVSIADYLLDSPPQVGSLEIPKRDTYYWYYATQVMFHMGGAYWEQWNNELTPMIVDSQIKEGAIAGSWDPLLPVPDRWSAHAGRVYVTAMNLLNLEIYYRHLPIYEETSSRPEP